jgi:hypothetical protein
MEDVKPVKMEDGQYDQSEYDHITMNGHSNLDVKPKTELQDLFSTTSPKRSTTDLPLPPLSPPSETEDFKPKPRGRRKGGQNGKASSTPPPEPTLIAEYPVAWDEAHETFESLDKCVYERKDMGLSRELDEMMVCDCIYDRRESLATSCMVGAGSRRM